MTVYKHKLLSYHICSVYKKNNIITAITAITTTAITTTTTTTTTTTRTNTKKKTQTIQYSKDDVCVRCLP